MAGICGDSFSGRVVSTESQRTEVSYGLDCSWPIQNFESSCGNLLGDRKAIYDDYIRGCGGQQDGKGVERCTEGEKTRLAMSRRQPQSMVVSDTAEKENKNASTSEMLTGGCTHFSRHMRTELHQHWL